MNKRLFLAFLLTLFAVAVNAAPYPPATNKDGSVVSGKVTAAYDPLGQNPAYDGPVYPLPFNLIFSETKDLTLNPPVDDPDDFSDPFVALSALDGFSTTERWLTTFDVFPNQVDPSSVVPGRSVRFFEVSTVRGTIVIVSGIVRELTPGVDFFATMANSTTLAIIPLKPLKEMTTYMAVLTNDIHDTAGNDATPDSLYHFTKAQTPWFENGQSTSPFFSDEDAEGLEEQRQITASMEAAAASVGIPKEDIILSWTAQTQSVTPVLKSLRSIARPAPTQVAKTPYNTSILGAPGIADIYIGVITLPYYLGAPSAENPTAPLTGFFKAAPGAYVPPFDAVGLDPTSTNVTVANPFPVKTGDQTVPLLLTLPNAGSGQTKPAAGWPVVIFGHAIGGNRANLLAAADAMAAAGYAVIGIDSPLHGILPDDPLLAPLYVGNTPWAPVANERTFDLDLVDNTTGAPGPDGKVDPSGTHFINPLSLLTTRDNVRQGQADLSILAASLVRIDVDGDSLPDLDASTVSYAGVSLGSIMGTAFTAVEPLVPSAFLSTPAGGFARALEASPTFGPRLRAGLAAAGIEPGTDDYEKFFTAFQTVIDSMDPINWIAEAANFNSILLHEVVGDTVFPNAVATAPLSGTDPLVSAGGLTLYSATLANPAGVDAAGKFAPPATHGSLLDPSAAPTSTVEMQKQMASYIASRGKAVVVENGAAMEPVAEPAAEATTEATEE